MKRLRQLYASPIDQKFLFLSSRRLRRAERRDRSDSSLKQRAACGVRVLCPEEARRTAQTKRRTSPAAPARRRPRSSSAPGKAADPAPVVRAYLADSAPWPSSENCSLRARQLTPDSSLTNQTLLPIPPSAPRFKLFLQIRLFPSPCLSKGPPSSQPRKQ